MTDTAEQAQAPLSKDRLRLWLKLLKASGMVETEVRRRLRQDYGSTLPRFDVMSALSRHPEGLKMSQISTMLRVSNGNITGIVDKLTDEGLAQRMAVPGDRRAALVRLTDRGMSEFSDHAESHEDWIDEILGALTLEDVSGMSARLDRLITSLEQQEDR